MGLDDAASFLGISTRQVRRDVRDGKLSARGGGRGVPLAFGLASLKKRRDGLLARRAKVAARFQARYGVFDGDTLARAVYGLHYLQRYPAPFAKCEESCLKGKDKKQIRDCMETDCPDWRFRWPLRLFPEYETQNLWRMWRRKSPGVQLVRNGFPPLADVPGDILETVRGLCDGLGPDELDFLGGMVVAVAHPWRVHQPEEKWPLWLGDKLDAIPDKRVRDLVENAVFSGDVELLRDLIELDSKPGERRSLGAEADKALAALRDENGKAPPRLLSAARKAGAAKHEKGRGRPSGNRVCILLGIHRTQGSRIAARIWKKWGADGAKEKWGADGAKEWFKLLGCPGARLWKQFFKSCPDKPVVRHTAETAEQCLGCGGALDAWDLHCPVCGAPVIEQRVGGRKRPTASPSDYAHLTQAVD